MEGKINKVNFSRVFSPKAKLLPQSEALIYWQGGLPESRLELLRRVLLKKRDYRKKTKEELTPLPFSWFANEVHQRYLLI